MSIRNIYGKANCNSQQILDTKKGKNRTKKKQLLGLDDGSIRHAVLNQSHVIERISRSLFIEENDIIVNLLFNRKLTCNVKVHEQLRFDPTVNCFHRCVVCRSPCSGHGTSNAIHWQEFIESFWSIYRTLVECRIILYSECCFLSSIRSSKPLMYVILPPRLEESEWLTISLFQRSIYSVNS